MSKQKFQIISKLKKSFFFHGSCHLITRSTAALMLVSSSSPTFLGQNIQRGNLDTRGHSFFLLEKAIKRREKEKETFPISSPRPEKNHLWHPGYARGGCIDYRSKQSCRLQLMPRGICLDWPVQRFSF